MSKRALILKIALTALFSALIFVLTSFLPIPYAGGAGYFNFSDLLILFSSAYFGPFVGVLSGIIGASLSDLYVGFANSIPFTIIAKALEAIVFSLLFYFLRNHKYLKHISFFIAPVFMVASYIPYYLIYDNGQGVMALVSSCFDLIQGTVSGTLAILLYLAFYKIKIPLLNNTYTIKHRNKNGDK